MKDEFGTILRMINEGYSIIYKGISLNAIKREFTPMEYQVWDDTGQTMDLKKSPQEAALAFLELKGKKYGKVEAFK